MNSNVCSQCQRPGTMNNPVEWRDDFDHHICQNCYDELAEDEYAQALDRSGYPSLADED